MKRRVSVTVNTDVEIFLSDLDTEDLKEELKERVGVEVVETPSVVTDTARIERLYYRSRGSLDDRTAEDLRDLVADLYGRAA